MATKTGVQMRSGSMTSGLFGTTLWRMAQKLQPTERVKPKDGKAIRAAAASAASKKLDLSDEQVIEARRAFEAKEKTCRELADSHGVSYARMYKILDYSTRTFGL
jgi:hypothetical protein